MLPSSSSPFLVRRKFRTSTSFTIVELLVVIGIIVILMAIAVPEIPSLLRSNAMDSNVATLSGIMEQARETAISGSTYVWVAFTSTNSIPGDGIWVATFESQDGTESPVNTSVVPAWVTSLTIPTANLQMVSKPENLPGVMIVDPTSTSPLVPTALTDLATAGGVTNPASLFETNMQWTVTSMQFAEGNSTNTYFTRAVEFTPDGEAHVQVWNSNIQFVMVPSLGSSTNNDVLLNLSRLTGKLTIYRP